MRPYWVLLPLFGAAVSGADAGGRRRLVQRQDESSTDVSPSEDPTEVSTTEEPTETSTTEEPDPETSTTSTTEEEEDVTVTVTTTVEGEGETVSSRVTRTVTSTTVITDVTTERETITVTSSDQDTATETVYSTTTVFGSRKRDTWLLDILPAEPAAAAAPFITAAPTGLDADSYEAYNAEMIRREAAPQPGPNIFKRATITETETVTEGGGDTTVVATVTQTVVTASTVENTETETITETEQVDASTTVTTTKIFTVTSNTITTDIFTAPITESSGPAETDPADSDDSSDGGGGGGLSTGAKAGIGAGAGVVGLVIIGALAWFCLKKRHSGPKHESDDLFGASEVPVGAGAGAGAGSGSGRGAMSHQPSTSTSYAPTRSPILPNVAPEGYRGTALGDGRAGYAKPEPYGSAYTRPSAQHPPPTSVSPVSPPATGYSHPTNRTSTFNSGPDYLPEHHHPADMNGGGAYGTQRSLSTSPGPHAAELGHEGHSARWQSPGAAEVDTTPAGYNQRQQPPSNVFEMPAPQDHR